MGDLRQERSFKGGELRRSRGGEGRERKSRVEGGEEESRRDDGGLGSPTVSVARGREDGNEEQELAGGEDFW